MDLARFHYAINQIDLDAQKIEVDRRLTKLINALNNLVANPGNAEIAQAFKTNLDGLRDSLLASALNAPEDPDVAEAIEMMDLKDSVGQGLAERIVSTIASNQLTPALAAAELEKLKSEVLTTLKRIHVVNDNFTELGVEYYGLPPSAAEMRVAIPLDSSATLADVDKEVRDWNKITGAICETFDPDRSPVTVQSIASGSLLLYLAGAAAFILGVNRCLKGVNGILAELIRMKDLYGQLVEAKAPKEVLNGLENHNSGKVKKDLAELAHSLVDEYYKGNDTAPRNELKNSLTMALQRLSRKLAEGTKIRLRIAAPKKPELAEGQEPSEQQNAELKLADQVDAQRAELNQGQITMDISAHQEAIQKALPGPDPESDDKPAKA